MEKWLRSAPFEPETEQEEIWINGTNQHKVHVTFGKPMDVLSLKSDVVQHFKKTADRIRTSRMSLFQKENVSRVEACPICKAGTKNHIEVITVYGATYVYCDNCCHCYVSKRPSDKALEDFYANDTHYQKTYSDKHTTEARIRGVAMPKAQWVIRQFERLHGKKPDKILDVGAGSGHFVYACRQLGIEATGLEPSRMGIQFAKDNLGCELLSVDFLDEWVSFKDFDVITFWGVIEHVPNPVEMLKAASRIISGRNGLVVAEVPRWNGLSTVVQKLFHDSITRHLDPLGHINCFTDSSLATAFALANLNITSAWYFGMDAYELTTQLSHYLEESSVFAKIQGFIPQLQGSFDLARMSDEIVLSGIS
ncbi:MAG: class I SAM-dependent methyltransferase [Pseudomonadota bacterium]